ncbi:MAG: phosphoglucosamine mutase [Candidatus Altiarchaeota archaeon]
MRRLFGTSGVRKKLEDFPKDFSYELALALGSCIADDSVALGRDTRSSGPDLEKDFVRGLSDCGCNSVLLGIVPTPTVGVAASEFGTGVMITASHNPPDYNGFKFWGRRGAYDPVQEEDVEEVYFSKKWEKGDKKTIERVASREFLDKHKESILSCVGQVEKEIKVLLDCSGGSGSALTPELLTEMGCNVISVNTNQDGIFPHGLEPTAKNLAETAELVKRSEADIGLVHDGDADRTAAIGKDGKLIDWDSFLSVLAYGKDKIVTTVDASMRIEEVCKKVFRTAVGDVAVVNGIREHDADFGGEPSGTYIFPDIHLYPDGVATAAKVVKMLSDGIFYEILEKIPTYPTKRVKIPCEEGEKAKVMEKLHETITEDYSDIDGIRITKDDGWVLIRPSGTEPYLRITAEARSEKSLAEIVSQGEEWIKKARA